MHGNKMALVSFKTCPRCQTRCCVLDSNNWCACGYHFWSGAVAAATAPPITPVAHQVAATETGEPRTVPAGVDFTCKQTPGGGLQLIWPGLKHVVTLSPAERIIVKAWV